MHTTEDCMVKEPPTRRVSEKCLVYASGLVSLAALLSVVRNIGAGVAVR
jgi:hypothetical protein